MKRLCLTLILLTTITLFAKTPYAGSKFSRQSDSTLLKLKNKKTAADRSIKKNSDDLIILVKLPGKKTLVRIVNGEWPEEIEYTYNVLKDPAGRVILVSQVPYSESGDWFITYTHYFDEYGKTYAFRKETNVFDDDVKGGIVFETLLKYYNTDFKVMKQFYTLQDKGGKAIKDNGHIDIYRYKYAVFKKVGDCLKAYNIKATE